MRDRPVSVQEEAAISGQATADAGNLFAESDETNNTTWVDLKLTLNHKGKGNGGNRVSVIGYGPTP